jgi:dTDP-4-dehydrorhamnose reductase
MKVLVTGYAGQLGYEVVRLLDARGVECRGADLADFNLTDAESVLRYVRDYAPDVIVHCAGYTNVDKAESEPEVCAAVNGMGTVHMVRAALNVGAKLVYISSDYVFPGTGDTPYEINDPYGPKNVYGVSKVQGEDAVRSLMTRYYILRTSWVFGKNGRNFVRTMLRLGAEKKELRVVCDQIGSPTYAKDLARVICDMIATEKYGIYHVRNEGFVSWADFARMIMEKAGLPCRIIPVDSSEYASLAKRPLNSRLSGRKLAEAGFAPMPSVEDALDRYLEELKEE